MDTAALEKQVEELQMIQCSLLPGEIMTFIDEIDFWNNLLEIHSTTSTIPDQLPTFQAHFQVKVEAVDVWFEVLFPFRYIGDLVSCCPTISVKGLYLGKIEQERLQKIVEEGINEFTGSEYPIYQLLSIHLIPLLHTMRGAHAEAEPSGENLTDESAVAPEYHALLTSHHLISPNKRRSLQQWSGSLSITGFAKVGYPGVIYACGAQESVEEFVANVKAMQWLALKVRFVEPVMEEFREKEPKRQWAEFQKVGEVVEEMKRLGREQFIVEMGIGSLGTEK
ncbi:hypothetical protein BDZ94DRAFT_1166781 [Collybia nuda]|uniref:Small nuclear ribonucleoprotein Prp3 C-terminal domain-containing protein n=1 Tax=Collybia nuda TaxID=64659 RepID=A0A9P5Y466_9AGAR|nr:hypothetical protein BDZ94DRAFT_1166781 [Collybia nuda]